MSYVGRGLQSGAFRQLDDISSGFDGSDTTDCSVRVDLNSSGAFAANDSGGIYIVTTSGRLTMTAEL